MKLRWVLYPTCIFNIKGWYGSCCSVLLQKTCSSCLSSEGVVSYSSVVSGWWQGVLVTLGIIIKNLDNKFSWIHSSIVLELHFCSGSFLRVGHFPFLESAQLSLGYTHLQNSVLHIATQSPVVKGEKLKGIVKVNHRWPWNLQLQKEVISAQKQPSYEKTRNGCNDINTNSVNIIAAISWPPPLISQLFSPRIFKATPFFTAWLFLCGLFIYNDVQEHIQEFSKVVSGFGRYRGLGHNSQPLTDIEHQMLQNLLVNALWICYPQYKLLSSYQVLSIMV